MAKIKLIQCEKVLNSRGNWTIETAVTLDDGSVGTQAVPNGASKGEHEAVYIPVEKAIEIVSHPINDLLLDYDAFEQDKIDKMMLDMDGTENKSHLGGNSILSVSLAVAKAAAISKKIELFQYLQELYGEKPDKDSFPTPVFNILNGGKHADNGLSFQEFMVIPAKWLTYDKALEIGVDIYHTLEKMLSKDGYSVGVGDEGGFAPENFTVTKAIDYLRKAVNKTYDLGEEVFLGMDVAAESFFNHNEYVISEEKLTLSSQELADYYKRLLNKYEIIFLEDPFYEGDVEGWKEFNRRESGRVLVVADDLVVTNPKFLDFAIESKLANAVIVKPNQVGTLSEMFEFVKKAKSEHMEICVSHRSGDTAESTFISDLAVAVGADFIKSGAPARGERVAKYNRLLDIFHLIT